MPKLPAPGRVALATALVWFAFLAPANAYIDGATTTIIFQSVVAGLAAGGMFLKVFKQRLLAFFRRGDDDTAAAPLDTTSTGDAEMAAATGEGAPVAPVGEDR